METWDFAISFCPPATLEIDLHIYTQREGPLGLLVQGPDPSGTRYADPPPVLLHWKLVLKHFRY